MVTHSLHKLETVRRPVSNKIERKRGINSLLSPPASQAFKNDLKALLSGHTSICKTAYFIRFTYCLTIASAKRSSANCYLFIIRVKIAVNSFEMEGYVKVSSQGAVRDTCNYKRQLPGTNSLSSLKLFPLTYFLRSLGNDFVYKFLYI